MTSMNGEISRRNFLWKILIGVGALLSALIGIPVVGFVISPILKKIESNWVPVAWEEDLQSKGPQEVTFTAVKQDAWLHASAKRSVYVLRENGNKVTVFSTECTHLGCSVRWNADENKFQCPCHGGQYDITGKVIGGPPPRPLTQLETKIENGRLFVKES